MRWWTFGVVAAIGCGGGKGADDSGIVPLGDDDDDTFVPPVDTGLEGGSIDAAAFVVIARFGFDPALGHVGYAPPAEGLAPMSFTVLMLDSDALYDGVADETTSCAITLEVPGPAPRAAWVDAAEGAWTGFDLADAGTVTVRDQCRFYGLPGVFDQDAGSHVAKWSWGAGIGELDPQVGEAVRVSRTPSEWAALEPVLVGGRIRSDLLIGLGTTVAGDGVSDQAIAVGYEVDGNFEIVAGGIGDLQPIPKEAVPLPKGGVARGYYEVQYGPVGPGDVLTREPGGY